MKSFSINALKELANFKSGLCVSIFLPTHQSGQEVLQGKDQLVLKNQIKEISRALQERGFSEKASKTFLNPLYNLVRDYYLWRHLTQGLAIFLASNHFSFFKLPFPVPIHHYVDYVFYLKPLFPYLINDENYHLLSLSLQEVKLYQGNRERLEEVIFDPPLPQQLEQVVGFDYSAKFVGYHASKVGGHQQAIFHGHGEWKADEKVEISQFFSAIDQFITPLLHSNKAPLIVASLNYLFAIYEKANSYNKLLSDFISVNPTSLSRSELHHSSWNLLLSSHAQEREKQADRIKQFQDTEQTSIDIQEIISAAMTGRIEVLFLDKDEEIWGVYDKKSGRSRLERRQNNTNTSLTNLIAIQVFLNGGSIYLVSQYALPLPVSAVNALFRY